MPSGRFDIDDLPGWDALADDLDHLPDGVILRRGGRRIARLRPEDEWDPRTGLTPELRERLAAIPVHGTDGNFLPDIRGILKR